MPIDGSIPLGTRGVGPLVSLSDLMQQSQQMWMQREQAEALAEQRRAIAEQRAQQTAKIAQENADRTATGEAIRQGGGVRDQTLAWARANAPNTVPTLTEFFDKADEKATTIKQARLKIQNDEADFLGDLADSILRHGTTPETLGGALSTGISYAVEQFPDFKEGAERIQQQLAQATPEQITAFLSQVRDQAPSRRMKPTGPQVVAPGSALVGDDGQVLYSAPAKVEPPKAGTFEDFLTGYAQQKGRTVAQLSPGDKLRAKAQWEAAGRAPAGDGSKFWVMRDGKPLRVSEAEYRPGDAPASTREQGRPVTSGDAGTIAEFDSALDDLAVLRGTVTPKKDAAGKPIEQAPTGTTAKLGAMVPNWITDWTGVGASSKSKQAVIDRVKQVIGKALEGGVLRKEDEYKYEKILPTIADTGSVVETKLAGLESAIKKRRQRQLDSLADAGYDTSKYSARDGGTAATPATGAPAEGEERPIPGVPGGVAKFTSGKWIRVR